MTDTEERGESSYLLANSNEEPEKSITSSQIMRESAVVFQLAWPISLGIFVLGHLGTKELASSALATMYLNVTGLSIIIGMATGLDTLCSQAHTGSSNKYLVGHHLQVSFVIMAALCLPISILWLFAREILVLCGQDDELSKLAAEYTRLMIPGLVPFFLQECIKRFLQAQGIMKAHLYMIILVSPLNALLQYSLVKQLGYQGAPIGLVITYSLMATILILYAKYIEGGDCWGGFEPKVMFNFRNLWQFAKFGIPGIAQVGSEWWAFEVVALAAGLMGDVALAAQTVVLNTCTLTYTIPLGISIAASTRIGNQLGANKPFSARLGAVSTLAIGLSAALVNCVFLFLVRHQWGYLWNPNDHSVADTIASILPLAAFFQLSDAIGAITGGILRGVGLQRFGAYINIAGYYLIGLPLGLALAFPPWGQEKSLGLKGLWIGLTVALIVVSFVQLFVIFRLDWTKETRNAQERILDSAPGHLTFEDSETENLIEEDSSLLV